VPINLLWHGPCFINNQTRNELKKPREVVMKKLLLALIILSTLVSCGKKNTVGTTASSTSAITITNLPVASQAVASALGTLITNNSFGNGQATYYETYAQYVAHAPNTTYKYGAMTSSGSGSNCHTVWSIFTYCTSGTTSTSTATVTRSVIHSAVDLVTKQNELIAIVNKTNQIQQDNYMIGVYYILTTDNIRYTIDARLPMQANPVQTQQATGTGETLVGIQ
jgi:hypothetical protein